MILKRIREIRYTPKTRNNILKHDRACEYEMCIIENAQTKRKEDITRTGRIGEYFIKIGI